MRSYETARRFFGFLEFMAWLIVLLGIGGAIIGLMIASDVAKYQHVPGALTLIGLIPGLFVLFLGVIGIVLAQSSRASVDTAELTGQILKVARDQLEVSKQGQRQSHAAATDFSTLAERKDAAPGVNFTAKPAQANGAQAGASGSAAASEISAAADAALPAPSVGFENLATLNAADKMPVSVSSDAKI